MATSAQDIRGWLAGSSNEHTHMIVVCDTFDHEDYPVFCNGDKDCLDKFNEYSTNMQRVIEVYDLKLNIEGQVKEHRAFHLPEES